MSSTSFVAAFVALFVVAAVSADSANCPSVTPFANLDSSRLSGDWFGTYGNNVGVQAPQLRCLKGHFEVTNEGVFTSSIEFIKHSTNERISKTAVGTPVGGEKGQLHFVNSANPAKTEDTTIIDTDYDNYIIWITCINREGHSGYNVAVTTRTQDVSSNLLQHIKEQLQNAHLEDTLVPVSYENC